MTDRQTPRSRQLDLSGPGDTRRGRPYAGRATPRTEATGILRGAAAVTCRTTRPEEGR